MICVLIHPCAFAFFFLDLIFALFNVCDEGVQDGFVVVQSLIKNKSYPLMLIQQLESKNKNNKKLPMLGIEPRSPA